MKNPSILFTVMKIMALSMFIVYIFVCCITACSTYREVTSQLWDITCTFGLVLLITMVVCVLGYLLYAAFVGGKYCILFEMDEKGVLHTQLPPQFKKAQAISTVLILAGAATGNVGRIGQGLTMRGKQKSYSTWESVKSVNINKKLNIIKVNETLNKNQVYASDEDFDFVANFILEHVSDKCKIS